MTDIEALLKQYEEVNAELNKQISENGKAFVESLFQEVFDQHEGLNVIGIVGWTMGFNDGEPCYHQQHTYVGEMQYSSWRDRTYPDFEDESGDFAEDFEYDEDENTHLNSKCETLSEVSAQITAYDEIIERVFDTNFKIVVTRGEDGKVVVNQDWYDCGY